MKEWKCGFMEKAWGRGGRSENCSHMDMWRLDRKVRDLKE